MEQQTQAKSLKNVLLSKWYFPNIKRAVISPQDEKELKGRLRYSTQLADVKGKTIIVFGDGYGWYANYALSHGAKLVHSLDPSNPSDFIHKLSKRKNFRHFQMSLFDFSPHIKYDLAVFLEVLEHLPPGSEPEALKIIYNALTPQGELLFSTPYKSLLAYVADPPALLGHRHYSQKHLEMLFKNAGFKSYTIYRGGYFLQAIDIFLMYFFNNVLRRKYNALFDNVVDREYPHRNGTDIFALCQKW